MPAWIATSIVRDTGVGAAIAIDRDGEGDEDREFGVSWCHWHRQHR